MMSVSSECCAYGCRNRPDYKLPGITFHVFPKDPVRRKAWIEAVRKKNIPDFEPLDYTKICSEHFREECFDRSKKRVFLLAHAVPTIFGTPKSTPNVKHPLAKIYSNGAVKRKLSESEDEDDVIFREPSEDEDEYNKQDNSSSSSSSSDSPLEESEPEETPETEVVYVSEEAMSNYKPSIIKVAPDKPQPTVAVHNDIMKALETYSKMKPSSSASKGEVSLVMLQPPTSPSDPTPQVLTPVQLVEFSPQALTELYERNIRELKTARQKSRRYKEKIARLEKIVKNFERCGSSEEEDSEEELGQIEVNRVYEQLRRKQEREEGGSDLVNLEAGES